MEYFMFLTGSLLIMSSLMTSLSGSAADINSRFFLRSISLTGVMLLLATVHGWA